VGGAQIDLFLRCRVDPSVQDAAAGKDKAVLAAIIDDGELQVAIERR
jgi:hypothetical protein